MTKLSYKINIDEKQRLRDMFLLVLYSLQLVEHFSFQNIIISKF